MTVTTLREQFNLKCFGKTTSSVSTDVIDSYLNQAYQDFLIIVMPFYRWRVNGEIATTDIVSGQREYPLPTDILRVIQVKMDDVVLTEDQYDIFDKSIMISEDHSDLYASDSTDGLELTYQDEYTALVLTADYPKIPTAFHPWLYKKASREYCENKEIWNKFKALDTWCANEVARIEDHYYNKTTEAVVLTPQGDDYY